MQIFYLEIHDINFCANDIQLLRYVSSERKEKVLRYCCDIDRLLSLYSVLLTRMTLSNFYNIDIDKLIFALSEHGKPYLVNLENIYFNLSHTRNCILLCITDKSPVGADIELINNAPFEIANYVFHIDEIDYINSFSNDIKTQRFYEIWTKKESYLKKCGTGLINDIQHINTLTLPTYFYSFLHNNYMCTICSDKPCTISVNQITKKDIYDFFLS